MFCAVVELEINCVAPVNGKLKEPIAKLSGVSASGITTVDDGNCSNMIIEPAENWIGHHFCANT